MSILRSTLGASHERSYTQWQGVLDQAKTDASSADRGAANGKNYLTGVAPEHNGELLFVAMRADAPEIELCIERKRQDSPSFGYLAS